jgi:hypothetical protein
LLLDCCDFFLLLFDLAEVVHSTNPIIYYSIVAEPTEVNHHRNLGVIVFSLWVCLVSCLGFFKVDLLNDEGEE